METIDRKLNQISTPSPHNGFLGAGHTARYVIEVPFSESDPFIFLADDLLDKKDTRPVGGPHPHAGFETVTLMLEGEIGDGDHTMRAGDFQMMTAGSGIVHTETIEKKARMRLLQLWLSLPEKDRWTTPRVQDLSFEDVPKASGKGWEARVYSGSYAGITSPVLNHAPFLLVDLHLSTNTELKQQLPAHFSAFLYVIEGNIKVGQGREALNEGQVGWLDRYSQKELSDLLLVAGDSSARIVLYAAEPQKSAIVSQGPFIGNTQEDIPRLYKAYSEGKMKHVSTLPKEQMFVW